MTDNGLPTANPQPGSPAATSTGGASSTGEVLPSTDRNLTTLDTDRSADVKKASKASSNNTPSQDAAPTIPNADNVVSAAVDDAWASTTAAPTASAGPNFRANQSLSGQKVPPWRQLKFISSPDSSRETSPRLGTVTEQSNLGKSRNPHALDTSYPSTSVSGILSRQSIFVASPEDYQSPKGPLRVVNTNSPADTQNQPEFMPPATRPLRIVRKNSEFDTQSLSEDSLPSTRPPGVLNNTSPVDAQAVPTYISPPDPPNMSALNQLDKDSSGFVSREDFNQFKGFVSQDMQAIATQLRQASNEGWENVRKKDAKINDLEKQVEMLRAALNKSGKSSSQQLDGGTRREPQTRTPKEVHTSGRGLQLYYATLPARLRRLAVDLILLRAQVAKSRKDWVTMEHHCTRAVQVAQVLNDKPISAWCGFNRGIAFFGQGKWAPAEQAFEDARPCVGVHISVAAAEQWRQKLKAVYESPMRSTFKPYTPYTPHTPHTPYTMKSTPIDQTLFAGFESLNTFFPSRTPSKTESVGSVVPSPSGVPVIRQPPSPATLRSRFRAGQRRIYEPRVLGSIVDSTEFEPSSRHKPQTLQEFTNQAIRGKKSPTVGRSAVTPSSDLASPFNIRRGSQFAAYSTIPEETERSTPSPPPLRQAARRFSLDTNSSPHRALPGISAPDYPQRSNSLSINFKPGSKQSEPCVDSSPSQQPVPAAKLFNPVSSPLSSSISLSNRLIPSSQPPEGLNQQATPFILSSGSSPDAPILPPDDGSARAAITYPYSPRRNKSVDTASAGSLLMSPQVIPPDLDDNRQEFTALTIIDSPSQLNTPSSHNEFQGVITRDLPPLVRERISVGSAIRAGLGLGGGVGGAEEAGDSSIPSWQDERVVAYQEDANKPLKETRVTDEGEKLISQVHPPSDPPVATQATLGDLIPAPSEASKVMSEELVCEVHLQETALSNARHHETIVPSAEVAHTKGRDVNRETSMKEAGHVDREATNKGGDSGQKPQSENPFKKGIRKSRKDPDWDSLYDLSTSGSGSQNEIKAGRERDDAGDERMNQNPQSENPFRNEVRKSRKDPDFDSLYDVSTSGSGSRSGADAGDGGDKAGDERTNDEKEISHGQNQAIGETS